MNYPNSENYQTLICDINGNWKGEFEMKRKRKFWIVSAVVLLLAVLLLPMPIAPARDGGTREYVALAYKVVKWRRFYGDDKQYIQTKVYFIPDNFKSLDELWEEEAIGLALSTNEVAHLRYKYVDKDIAEPLTEEETVAVREILKGKRAYRDDATPSCGFNEEISITFGDQIFCLACDDCGIIKIAGEENLYINLTDAQRDAIEAIFEAHGGSFPCV